MFSNRQQNSSNVLHTVISSTDLIILPPPPPAISLTDTVNSSNNSAVASVATTILALDGLNCGGIPTRTTPTLTPTTLRTIAADLDGLTSGPPEDFSASAVSDLHHLVSSSCATVNTPSSGTVRLSSNIQDRHNIQNLGNHHITLQNLNNQHINLTTLQSHQHLNQNSLNQQQRNDYNNSFSSTVSRQAGFVPPLVLQVSSCNTNTQQLPTTAVLLNNSSSGSSSVISVKGSSTSASSSNWQGVVVTQTPQHGGRSVKQEFTDDEDGEENYDSNEVSDSSDTNSGKLTRKSSTKNNKSSIKTEIKSEFKTSTPGRRSNKDNKIMSAEEEQRRQIRRERNKLAAARCRKRRMDHTNELLEETEELENKRLKLQVKIQGLRQQKTDLQQMLAQHKCTFNVNNGSISNSVTAINNATIVLGSNEISESATSNVNSNMTTIKRNSLQQQNISTNTNSPNNCSTSSGSLKSSANPIISQPSSNNKNNEDIPVTVVSQNQRTRPTTLLQLNNSHFGESNKMSTNNSNGVVVLNFDSLMDGGTGLTPVSTSAGNVQNHHQQVQLDGTGSSGVDSGNNV